MKTLTFLLLFSLSAHAQENIDLLLDAHYERVERIKESNEKKLKNSFTAPMLKRIINKLTRMHKKRMTESMLNYFALNPASLITFKDVSEAAEKHSRSICKQTSNKRHKDDEVDAVRHLVWSALLSYYLGSTKALALSSLQEDIKKIKINPLKMDVYNNYLGIAYGSKLRANRRHGRGVRNIAKLVSAFALETLNNGQAYVIGNPKGKTSSCTRSRLYPNN